MTQEEKELLLKDLCARLPYGIKCDIDGVMEPMTLETIKYEGEMFEFGEGVYERYITQIKPYLRPMESMTEEEKDELKEYLDAEIVDCNGFGYSEGGTLEEYTSSIPYSLCSYIVDWLIAHHFDYRGLIPMNLALPATEGMYNIERKGK